ncbi:MAG: HisA/HisF-related TIM barrel protein [Methanocalculus sp.]|uniref:HisA/HisF-related TIM barrel protein n=1 Tax=Methanocalculus sp. TaxID=2004547 RepID=UPI0027229071|nr:HisA/HisF-related TIM barrel protein [Methanocalculus sp.]MDO9538704.1 HisA/HisF-related TIM barrel protein [Methanocalculus sp.]
MKLICAIDLHLGQVVHGKGGRRSEYSPLTWGISNTAEPRGYLQTVRPRFVYIADLDRIMGDGSHDEVVLGLSDLVDRCYLDRGCRGPDDMLNAPFIENVIGTETAGPNLSGFPGGYLSVDVKAGSVVPGGEDPVAILSRAEEWGFSGCILLQISAVGEECGIDCREAERIRSGTDLPLFYGGGVKNENDLSILSETGFDGAIIATALHTGGVSLEHIRRGSFC